MTNWRPALQELMTMKHIAITILYVAIAAAAGGLFVFYAHPHAEVAKHVVVTPPPGARTPDPAFLSDYDRFVSLSADVTKRVAEGSPSIEQEQDEARGIVQRLTAAVPHGFSFDDKSRSFVPAGPMPAPPPPALPKK